MAELTTEAVEKAVEAILATLGEPTNSIQSSALEAFRSGDHAMVKRLASTNLSDNFVKALGYLGSAYKLTPNTDTILAESARSAAEHCKERTLLNLSKAISEALG